MELVAPRECWRQASHWVTLWTKIIVARQVGKHILTCWFGYLPVPASSYVIFQCYGAESLLLCRLLGAGEGYCCQNFCMHVCMYIWSAECLRDFIYKCSASLFYPVYLPHSPPHSLPHLPSYFRLHSTSLTSLSFHSTLLLSPHTFSQPPFRHSLNPLCTTNILIKLCNAIICTSPQQRQIKTTTTTWLLQPLIITTIR